MGQKKDTLLRWVNCCSDTTTSVERIKNLSDGWFFIHILSFLRSHPTDGTDPWLQTINILREYKLQENVVDYDAAASGNEDELAKLIVICMHLTMVQKPCEVIKEKTMWNLSTEDQKVIEAILLAIVNDDQLTRGRLNDVLQDVQETSFTKPITFYTSSPLSSLSSMKNSPLKRFLDSPMALRLTRLQKEISDKNDEIRRLQSELLSESDESSALTLRMEDLKRKVKDLEKKNSDLEQRLRDCQLPDSSGPDTDVKITNLKKKLKKMQDEYESSCQKYCDLNIEYEAMKIRQEKDRKQIRQLQIDLNETVARFERESAEYQLLLDSIRTENAELKHSLEEKAQWIDVLEEKSRTCSEMHARLNAPRSPCERESIGYSLLSIEAEKLQDDLESYRRDFARQSDQFDSEKRIFQQRTASLEEDKRCLHRQVEEANLENQSLHVQLDQAKSSLEQLSLGCDSLSKEKEELRHSLDGLQAEFRNEMSRAQQQLEIRTQKTLELSHHIDLLNQQLDETQLAKQAFEQSIQELTAEKMQLGQKMAALEQSHLDLQATMSANESIFQNKLAEASSQLEMSQQQIADQSQTINDLEEKLQSLHVKLAVTSETVLVLEAEKQQLNQTKLDLEHQNSDLKSAFEVSKQEFQSRLEKANNELELANTKITDFCETTNSLKAQLEAALEARLLSESRSSQLETDLNNLYQERDHLQLEVQQLLQAAQVSREEFQTEKDCLLVELESKKNEISEQANRILATEQKHNEAAQRINYLESSVRSLEQETAELITSKSFFDQQISTLQAAIDNGKTALQTALDEAKEEREIRENLIAQHKQTIQSLQVHLESLSQEKNALESQVVGLGVDKESLCQQLASLESSRKEFQTAHDILKAELATLQDNSRQENEILKQQIENKCDEITAAEKRLEQALQKEIEREACIEELNGEKTKLCCENDILKKEVSELVSTITMEKGVLECNLKTLKEELEINAKAMDDSQQKIQHLELELAELVANKSSLESEVDKLSAECCKVAIERIHLENENQRMDGFHKQQIQEFETRLSQLTEECTKRVNQMGEQLEVTEQLHRRVEEVSAEKAKLVEENDLLKIEVSNLTSCITKEKTMFETDLNALKEELESNIKVMEESQQKIHHMESELTEMIAQKSSLECEVEELSKRYSQMTEKWSHLEEEKQRMELLHKEQLVAFEHRLSELTQEHTERIKQLDERLETAEVLNHKLKEDCTKLENEREALHLEKSGFEQMYLETKAACEESETKVQLEGELARKDVEFKEQKLFEQSNALTELELVISNLRQEKETAESNYVRRIQILENEKQELLETQSRNEERNASLLASFEASRHELEQKLTDANLKLKEHVELLQQSHLSREQTERQMEILTVKVCKLESDLKVTVEEKGHLTNEMAVLQAVQGEMRNLEVAMEQLTSEIQELSCKKANLERVREVLEIEKANAEEEANRLLQDLESKEIQIGLLAEKVEYTESHLKQSQTEQQSLKARIFDLESTVLNLSTNASEKSQSVLTLEKQLLEREATIERSINELKVEKEQSATAQVAFFKALSDIQSSSDSNQRELETAVANLKRELDIEKQRSSEDKSAFAALVLAKKEASELADSLQVKLAQMEAEVDKLVKSEALLKKEKEEMADSDNVRHENEKLEMEQQISQLTLQVETFSKSCVGLETECIRLKADQLLVTQEKQRIEEKSREVEANLRSTVTELESQLKTMEAELQSKVAQVTELSGSVDTISLQIEASAQEKEILERNFSAKISTLSTENEMLVKKTNAFETEIQGLQSELALEKTKTSQGKGDIALEHRKEKAALEARLSVAQSQMKAMQEKLVNLTVANNSQAPLEHKVSILTNELEAANKAKIELEKRLDDSLVRANQELHSIKKEELDSNHTSKSSSQDLDAEIALLRRKYDNAKKQLNYKDDVVNQYAVKFEKMQNQLDKLEEEVASLNMEKKKLAHENRSLKTEQNYLLAQISSEKDKANARNTRHSLALQRGNTASEGGTLADAMIDARRRSLRPSRSDVVTTGRERQAVTEVFRAPQLAFGDGSDANSIFKIPPSRRDSTSSVCSNRSDISITSRGTNVPHGAGRLFTCDDEDGELFSSSYLNEMKEGKCRVEDSSTRVSELLRRNTMQPPHMRSAYPAEMNDERLRQSDLTIFEQPLASSSRAGNHHDTVQHLSLATSMLSMNTPPAMNTRKRRSSSWNPTDMETPVMQPRKRRSYELEADLSTDSNDTRSISSSAERKKHRDASLTSYTRPGPPTPARNAVKENISTPSMASSPSKSTSRQSAKVGSKRTSPTPGAKGSKLTPVGSLVRKVQAKLRSNIQSSSENTPSSTRTTPRGSKLNIFRKPLGSRSYNSDAKF
ncbi:golgin subfamily A member 4-like isoform X2 [Daphnia carinata]|uniref:golgin subfamily A member 4-like isoform X2 n=1 Tax=Daphnia carinata TaxID=120202 RepID=UPI0028685CA7|nr:golgin subfamily A member 4-like isoform X2 [Daphnia carinata]